MFGGYHAKPFIQAPDYFDENDINVNSDPADFFFVHIVGKGLYFFKPNNNITAEMHIDYDANGAMSMGTDFLQMSWSYDFRSTVGVTNSVTEVQLKSIKQAGGAFQ